MGVLSPERAMRLPRVKQQSRGETGVVSFSAEPLEPAGRGGLGRWGALSPCRHPVAGPLLAGAEARAGTHVHPGLTLVSPPCQLPDWWAHTLQRVPKSCSRRLLVPREGKGCSAKLSR